MESNECSGNATCANTDGSYNCTCKPGFNGDGFDCDGIIIFSFTLIRTVLQ